MIRVLRPLSIALLAASVTIAVACIPDNGTTTIGVGGSGGDVATPPPPTTAPVKSNLAIIGDSITFSAQPQLEYGFNLIGFDVHVSAKPGDMFRDRMPYAAELAATNPRTAIVNLGTNDSACVLYNVLTSTPCRFPTFTSQDIITDANAMRALFPASTCFIGVTPTFSGEMQQHWKSEAAAGRINGVADWAAQTTAHPDYLADGLGHLTESGKYAYARFLRDEQARICGGRA